LKSEQGHTTAGTIVLIIGGLIIFVALMVGLWHLDWFVKEKNTDRQTQVIDKSVGRQQALTSKVLRDIRTVRTMDAQVKTPALKAQRIAIVNDICDNAALLTGSITMPATADSFIQQECM
jgi:uncharacterized iron-regulated membrane protein